MFKCVWSFCNLAVLPRHMPNLRTIWSFLYLISRFQVLRNLIIRRFTALWIETKLIWQIMIGHHFDIPCIHHFRLYVPLWPSCFNTWYLSIHLGVYFRVLLSTLQYQGSFWAWAQPASDDVALQDRLSLAESILRIFPSVRLTDYARDPRFALQ